MSADPYDLVDALQCKRCDGGDFAYRISDAPFPDGPWTFSTYACPDCRDAIVGIIKLSGRTAEVVEVQGRAS